MGAAAVPLIAAGTVVSMYSQYRQGQVEGQVADNNATLARYRQADAVQQGGYDAAKLETAGRSVNATAEAGIAANNIDSTSGSMADLLTGNSAAAAIDAARARSRAARVAWGFTNEANDLTAQGQNSRVSGYLGALGSGLSGAGAAASAYSSYKADQAKAKE